jgi:hypothetical protein
LPSSGEESGSDRYLFARTDLSGDKALRFGPTFLALWVLAFTGPRVLGEELDSQLGHLCGIVPLIFWINVLQLEFLVGERDEPWDKALPCG